MAVLESQKRKITIGLPKHSRYTCPHDHLYVEITFKLRTKVWANYNGFIKKKY